MTRLLITLCAVLTFGVSCGADERTPTEAGSGASPTTSQEAPDPAVPTTSDPSGGQPLGSGPYPIADLVFDVYPDGTTGDVSTYRLACLGDTATLTGGPAPQPAESMCLALLEDEVRTRLIDGPPAERMCTEIYGGPQIAHIEGTLEGREVETSVDRTNGCGIDEWDRLLVGFLPPAA